MRVFPFGSCAAGVPHCGSVCQDGFSCAPVKFHQQLLRKFGLFQLPEEEVSLLGLFNQHERVGGPCQLFGQGDSEELYPHFTLPLHVCVEASV